MDFGVHLQSDSTFDAQFNAQLFMSHLIMLSGHRQREHEKDNDPERLMLSKNWTPEKIAVIVS